MTISKDRVFPIQDRFILRFTEEFLQKQFREIKSHKHHHGGMNYGKL